MPVGFYPSIDTIQEVVSQSFGVRLKDMVSDRRALRLARPRQVAMYLADELTLHSLPAIGRHFGGRDHTTVMHAIKVITHLCECDAAFAARVQNVKDQIWPG